MPDMTDYGRKRKVESKVKYYCMSCHQYHYFDSVIGQKHHYSGKRYINR